MYNIQIIFEKIFIFLFAPLQNSNQKIFSGRKLLDGHLPFFAPPSYVYAQNYSKHVPK
jgi:hypothetical protein